MKIVAVVLAGGLGLRLWPRSTEHKPKQFVHVLGEGTLIQNTVSRLLPFLQPADIHVVTTMDVVDHVHEQLPMIADSNIMLEPFGRNTGPAIALATTLLSERCDDDTVIVVLPSDHVVQNVREFHITLDRACAAASLEDVIVTIGVMPTRAETGFGYIQMGDVVPSENPVLRGYVKTVTTFAEKPDLATAQRFVDAGDFVWNSGIFVARIGVLRMAIQTHLPDHGPLFHMLEKGRERGDGIDALNDIYRQMRSVSFDIGVMEQADNVRVVEGSFGWSDVGTWDELYRLSMKDGKNNVIEGNVATLNTTNTLVSGSTGKLIGLVGVDNLIVVETDSAILICPRGKAEQTRDLVDFMRRRNIVGRKS